MHGLPNPCSAELRSSKEANVAWGGSLSCLGSDISPFTATRMRFQPYVLELIFSTSRSGSPSIFQGTMQRTNAENH